MRFLLVVLFSCCILALPAQMEKKRGTVRLRHPNGKIMAKGKVRDYKKQGLWKFYYDSGKLGSTMIYVNDTANGPYMEYLQDGRVKQQGTFCMNHKCGNWIHYDEDGHLESSENFKDDIQDGKQLFWYADGQLRDSMIFSNGQIEYHKGWYSTGRVRTIETYKDGAPEGIWTTYFDPQLSNDTTPATQDEYHNGVRNGWRYVWTGKVITEKYHYADGQLDGEATHFTPEGMLLSTEHYSQGLRNGESSFYKNGMRLKTEQYSYGQKNGTWEEFDRGGKVMTREWYTNDVMDSSIAYYTNGRKAISRKGNAARGWVWCQLWDSGGVYLMDGTEVDEQRQGDWCSYYPGGVIRACTSYDKGVITAYHKNYPSGKPMLQYNITGEKTFNEQAWTEKGKPIAKGTKQFDELMEGNRPGEILIDENQFQRGVIKREDENPPVNFNGSTEERIDERGSDEDFSSPPQREAESDTSQVFSYCELAAEFPGGNTEMYKFINANLRDPRAITDQRQGIVYVQYIVEKDGSVSNVKVIKGIPGSPDLDQAAVDVVTRFPKQSPGKINGKPVRSSQVIPIKFVSH